MRMGAFSAFYTAVLDLVFGKTDIEQRIRSLSETEFLALMRPLAYKDGTVSLFRYENPLIHDMIHALKYRGNPNCATLFATALDNYLQSIHLERSTLIPVPLAPKRKVERGHNQIELVLNQLPLHYSMEVTALSKIRNTKPQTSLKRKDRIRNLEGAFKVSRPEKILGSSVVLIDDVTTTGTTLKECSACLLHAGAKEIHRVALAR